MGGGWTARALLWKGRIFERKEYNFCYDLICNGTKVLLSQKGRLFQRKIDLYKFLAKEGAFLMDNEFKY